MSSARAIVLVLSMSACGERGPEAAAEAAAAPVVMAAVAEPSPRTAEPAVVADGPIDVAACDRYVENYRRCIAAMPERERAAHTSVVEGQRVAWAQAQRDAALAGGLAEECAAASAAAQVALPRCRW